MLRAQRSTHFGPEIEILNLHESLGNRAVRQVLQPKLKINQPSDNYEREAERMGERVMMMPDEKVSNPAQGSQNAQGKCLSPSNIDCKIVTADGTVKEDCNRIEQILDGIAEAKQLARGAADALRHGGKNYERLLKKHFGKKTKEVRKAIIQRFENIDRILGTNKYICDKCEIEKDAGGSAPHLCGQAPCPGVEIILCPPFGQAGCPPGPVILHEAAHSDGACGDIDSYDSTYSSFDLVDNAYSYEKFAVEVKGSQPANDKKDRVRRNKKVSS